MNHLTLMSSAARKPSVAIEGEHVKGTLFERRKLEPANAVQKLLVRRGFPELSIRLGGVELGQRLPKSVR
jgi:hypothetical protein